MGEILTVNKRKILKGFGHAKTEDADAHVKLQYKMFDKTRRTKRKARAVNELNAAVKSLGRPKK